MDRRSFLAGAATLGATAALPMAARAQTGALDAYVEDAPAQHIVRSFITRDWRRHFDSLRNGAILVDVEGTVLHYWSEDQSTYLIYPTSIPQTEEMTRRGRTTVTQKVEGPSWRPTPNMLRRNPDWPRYIGPGPENPLGTHALYLSWEYYRIHGTNDTRKVGRPASNGCFGLYNEDIIVLFDAARVGTQVLVI